MDTQSPEYQPRLGRSIQLLQIKTQGQLARKQFHVLRKTPIFETFLKLKLERTGGQS